MQSQQKEYMWGGFRYQLWDNWQREWDAVEVEEANKVCASSDCDNNMMDDPRPDDQWQGHCSICHDSMKPNKPMEVK